MKDFTVADLNMRGELQTKASYSYALLEQVPGALDLITHFATSLWRSPEGFELPLTPPQRHIIVRWRASAATSGILTVRVNDELASLSLLACGVDPDADRITLEAFQHHMLRELHDTRHEPAFALLEIEERPLVASINFTPPAAELDRLAVALTDRCFGAAYFRTHDLA